MLMRSPPALRGLLSLVLLAACGPGAAWDRDGDGELSGRHGPDCDDTDPEVNTRAAERCNGIDDDCDGSIDEDAADAVRWYRDSDHDGFGHDASQDPVKACAPPDEAWSSRSGDCDDTDPRIHPDVASDPCDGVDSDCDGMVDEDGEPERFYQDADDDGVPARDGATVTACVPPAGFLGAVDLWDCDDADPNVHPGATDIPYDGVDQDCAGDDDYDRDGDGYRCDPAVAPGCIGLDFDCGSDGDACDCNDDPDAGGADIHPDAWETADPGDVDEDCDGVINRVAVDGSRHRSATFTDPGYAGRSASVGAAILAVGDRDGDGYDDYLIGAPDHRYGTGYVTRISGIDAAAATGPGLGAYTWAARERTLTLGSSLAVYRNAVGSPTHYLFGARDALWIPRTDGPVAAGTPQIRPPDDCSANALPLVGLLITDGVYAVSAPSCGVVSTFNRLPPERILLHVDGPHAGLNLRSDGQLGRRMAVGDPDDDGITDLLLTVESDGVAGFMLPGGEVSFTGADDVSDDPGVLGFTLDLPGCGIHEDHPRSLAVLDFDGDGVDDVIVGCPGFRDEAHTDGAVFVYLGGASFAADLEPDRVWYGVGGALGASVASAGDALSDVIGDELLVTDGVTGVAYLLAATATPSVPIDRVALPFEATNGRIVQAVGVGNTDRAHGSDLLFAVQHEGPASSAHLLTWGP